MTTRQHTQSAFPSAVAVAIFATVAVIAVGFAAIRWIDDDTSAPDRLGSALAPTFVTPVSLEEARADEARQHEELTTRDFGPIGVAVLEEPTLDQQIQAAIAELENGLAAQMAW